jgi:predicted transcriptional regulator
MTSATEAERPTAKETVRDLLDRLPDDATLDDIMYELVVEKAVERGLRAAEAGETYTRAEAEAMLAEWRKSGGPDPQ